MFSVSKFPDLVRRVCVTFCCNTAASDTISCHMESLQVGDVKGVLPWLDAGDCLVWKQKDIRGS